MPNTAQRNENRLERVQGTIGFARRKPDEKAPPRDMHPGTEFPLVNYDVTICNARPIADKFSLDKEGFILIQRKLSCLNENDQEIMREKYLNEMIPFIKEYFGASWVTRFDLGGFTLRSLGKNSISRLEGVTNSRMVRGNGAGFAHIDYSSVAGPMIAARDCQVQGLEIKSYSRLMIVQAWQALSPPPQDVPLAFCDASSIAETDLVETEYRNYGVAHKTWLLHHSPSHRWYYFPDLTRDEIILFKGYDSAKHNHPWSAHGAFDNRHAYPNANPRESVETRFCVYYE